VMAKRGSVLVKSQTLDELTRRCVHIWRFCGLRHGGAACRRLSHGNRHLRRRPAFSHMRDRTHTYVSRREERRVEWELALGPNDHGILQTPFRWRRRGRERGVARARAG
jgi:hypothetical protein